MTNKTTINFFITITVDLKPDPTDCFFTLDCGCNWCPGWVVGDVRLPLTYPFSGYCLLYDATGVTHWVQRSKIKYRGESEKFNYYRYQSEFDWQKWRNFPKVDEHFNPKPENIRKESDTLNSDQYSDF